MLTTDGEYTNGLLNNLDWYFNGLVQDLSIYSASALEIPQFDLRVSQGSILWYKTRADIYLIHLNSVANEEGVIFATLVFVIFSESRQSYA